MEDLIQNAHILFDEHPPPSPPVPSHTAETMSYLAHGSFLSSEFSSSDGAQAMSSTTLNHPGAVGGIPTSPQSSFTAQSDSPVEGRLPPTLTPFLSPLLGLTSSQTLRERVQTIMEERVIPEPRGIQAVETVTLLNRSLSEVVPVPPTPVGEWWLPQPGLYRPPGSPTIPQSPSPSESVISSTTDLSFSASLLSSPAEYPSSPSASLLSTFSPTLSDRS
jgi:hypothetical protein